MNFIPRNKKTGVEYDPISDAEKTARESDPVLKGKYTYRQTSEPAKITAASKAPLEPVGVKKKSAPTDKGTDPEPTDEKDNQAETAL